MACKYSEAFPVPQQFSQIYDDFLQSLLKDKPEDIVDYGAIYFEAKNTGKEFLYIEPSIRKLPNPPIIPEEPVVLDGPLEDYEKTALMIQKKFRAFKIVKTKKEEKKNN